MVQRPGRSAEICASLEIAGAMRTTDGGEAWHDLNDGLVRLAERPHLQSALVQRETQAVGMLDGHAIAISPAAPDAPIRRSWLLRLLKPTETAPRKATPKAI